MGIFWVKRGSREDGRNDAENGESVAAIRVQIRVLVRLGQIVMIFPKNSRGAMGNPSVSKMHPLFKLIAVGYRRDCG